MLRGACWFDLNEPRVYLTRNSRDGDCIIVLHVLEYVLCSDLLDSALFCSRLFLFQSLLLQNTS